MSRIVWVPIKGFEDFYEVSNTGLVRSLHKRNFGNVLKTWDNKRGYLFCNLCKPGKKKTNGYIHKLVAEHFLKSPDLDNMVVNHLDGDKYNNNSINLEWCTHTENIRHASRLGKLSKGEEVYTARLTEEDVLRIRYMYHILNIPQIEINKEYKMAKGCISRIVNYKSWKHVP